MTLLGVLALVAVLAAGCGGAAQRSRSRAAPTAAGAHATARRGGGVANRSDRVPDPLLARLGLPPIPAGSPLPGYLLIADRDNNRLLIVSPEHKVVWRYPASGRSEEHTSELQSHSDLVC